MITCLFHMYCSSNYLFVSDTILLIPNIPLMGVGGDGPTTSNTYSHKPVPELPDRFFSA